MFNFIKSIFFKLSKEEIQILSIPRSGRWRTIRKNYFESLPDELKKCAVCDVKKNLIIHHIVPVHVDPTKELDNDNFIILCETPSFNCHLFFGHLKNWVRYNPNILEDAKNWKEKLNKIYR